MKQIFKAKLGTDQPLRGRHGDCAIQPVSPTMGLRGGGLEGGKGQGWERAGEQAETRPGGVPFVSCFSGNLSASMNGHLYEVGVQIWLYPVLCGPSIAWSPSANGYAARVLPHSQMMSMASTLKTPSFPIWEEERHSGKRMELHQAFHENFSLGIHNRV